jgi:hypothetical protein
MDNFLQGPSGCVSGAVSRQRPSGATAVVRQAGPAARQALGGTGGRSGLAVRGHLNPGWAAFLGVGFLGSDAGSLLLLADNYNRATTGHHRGTERTEDAQRTHRDFLAEVSGLPSSWPADPCEAAGQVIGRT